MCMRTCVCACVSVCACVHACVSVCEYMQLTSYNEDNNADQYHSIEQSSSQCNPMRSLHDAIIAKYDAITIQLHS